MKTYLILLGAQAISTETKEDAEYFADLTIYITLGLVVLMLLLSLRGEPGVLGGFNLLWLFLQYSRWSPLMDKTYSQFYKSFWNRMNYIFDRFEIWNSTADPPSVKFQDAGLKTTYFLNNSEEYLIIILVCLALSAGILVFISKEKPKKWILSLFACIYLLTCIDIFLFAYVQYDHANTGSVLSIINLSFASLAGFIYASTLIITIVSICKETGESQFTKYFTQEFKQLEAKIVFFYYPLILMIRIGTTSLYVFSSNSSLQFYSIIGAEIFLLLYLMIVFPYQRKIQNYIGMIYHLLELYILFLPLIYELEIIPESDLNNSLIIIVWVIIILCILKFGLDMHSPQRVKRAISIVPTKERVITDQRDLFSSKKDPFDRNKDQTSHPTVTRRQKLMEIDTTQVQGESMNISLNRQSPRYIVPLTAQEERKYRESLSSREVPAPQGSSVLSSERHNVPNERIFTHRSSQGTTVLRGIPED